MALNLLKCTRNLRLSLKALPSCIVSMNSHKTYATDTNEDKKVYELRVYQVYPKDVNTFMDLSVEWLHIRLKHSKLIGYWTSEIGGINDLVHLWEYDNLDHRAAVRQALAQDKEWVQNYFSKIKPWMPRQDNMLMQQLTNCNLNQPDLKGVCEIEQFSLYGGESKWKDKLMQFSSQTKGNGQLIGTFKNIIGDTNSVCILRHYKSQEDMLVSLKEAENNKDFTKARDSFYQDVQSGHSRLLLPAPWSPLK